MEPTLVFVVVIIIVALVFDYINGFHDAANSIAKTIGKDMVDIKKVAEGWQLWVILCGLIGAITWNLITWFYGIPSSSSHALVGGYAGAAVAAAGFRVILPAGG